MSGRWRYVAPIYERIDKNAGTGSVSYTHLDRALAKPDQITEKAKVIHIDIDPAEIGKNMKADIPIVGDIRLVLAALTEKAESRSPQEWLDMAAEWKLKNMLPEKHYDCLLYTSRCV